MSESILMVDNGSGWEPVGGVVKAVDQPAPIEYVSVRAEDSESYQYADWTCYEVTVEADVTWCHLYRRL